MLDARNRVRIHAGRRYRDWLRKRRRRRGAADIACAAAGGRAPIGVNSETLRDPKNHRHRLIGKENWSPAPHPGCTRSVVPMASTQVSVEPRPCTPRPHSTRASRSNRNARALIGPSPLPSYGPTATASPRPTTTTRWRWGSRRPHTPPQYRPTRLGWILGGCRRGGERLW